MTENVTGYNTQLGRGAATGVSLPAFLLDTYTQLLDAEEITPPEPTRQVDEFYVLDLQASKKLVGSLTFGPCSGTLARAFGDSVQDSMEDDAYSAVSVRRNWRIVLPDSGNETSYFVGYVSKFAKSGLTNQGRIQITFEIVVDGAVTIIR